MEHFTIRLETFKNVQCFFKVSVEQLALAGFYYSGVVDETICFLCNLKLYCWEEKDVPMIEHKKHNSRCPYPTCCKESVLFSIPMVNFNNKLDQIHFIRKKIRDNIEPEYFTPIVKETLIDTYDKVMKKMKGKVLIYTKHNHIVGLCSIADCTKHNLSYPLPCNCNWVIAQIELILHYLSCFYHYSMKEREDYHDI